ncbi:histone-lysine N-methyltransferase ATX1-like isoform X2 [Camellia sinensis]|uniref:histone-lysine N-methyltransferase ATX1-like isoform X2 n=1 Tax=Camellia sinensis TaxID=4442 RepID=UPI00103565CB|nr:histone-lysine N-methyltransferase ATX1-like isoform X2 [Camellia sinensis]
MLSQVHAKCYGELEPVDGVLWLCNLCCPGAPKFPPRCCLCPVIGGAMKPTTDGRWAHLACAIWIPETCLSDIKKMEPIDGLSRINKDRWKLLCSICGVSYGACIQVCAPSSLGLLCISKTFCVDWWLKYFSNSNLLGPRRYQMAKRNSIPFLYYAQLNK